MCFKNHFSNLFDYFTEEDIESIREDAKQMIESRVYASFRKFKNFLEADYLPQTRPDIGVRSLHNGTDFYQSCLNYHLTVEKSPQEVHEIGLEEVKRISKLMEGIMQKEGFNGTVSEYTKVILNKSKGTTREQLLDKFNKIIYDQITPKLPDYFENIPNISLTISAMPNDGPGGQYLPPASDLSRGGLFQVNLHHPETYPQYSMMALSLHEAIPGHHLQISYVTLLDIPEFRKGGDFVSMYPVPFQFPAYTAYIEGWALYSEFLGEEMGLYEGNNENLFGRYNEEILRACRLVVDTGMHMFNWTRDDAVQFLRDKTAMPESEIQVEIDRYITWPGQACGYKIGELKIRELRQRAVDQLGDKFNLKKFHTEILKNGPLPLHMLENYIDSWIEKMKAS
jgi:uncharacterized protein (DUF885 family)